MMLVLSNLFLLYENKRANVRQRLPGILTCGHSKKPPKKRSKCRHHSGRMAICIYIYIYRERQKERNKEGKREERKKKRRREKNERKRERERETR